MLPKELHQLKYEAISVPQGSVHLVKKTQERKSSTCYLLITKGVTSSSPVPLKTRHVWGRCTLNLSRAQTSSCWKGVVVKRHQLKYRPRQPWFKITRSGRKGDSGQRVAFQTGGFSGRRKREKAPRNGMYVLFKADRTTSKRIRNGFITVKSTTLIGLNSPRKNTTLPAIRFDEPRRTHIPV
ncbi:uncharacterized protein TNCV_2269511 [Trichonephila clavipes]|nr:uncharacterized protein TNCV_2269511 [Trichonephila clavipes]